jgi:hypothetical protein
MLSRFLIFSPAFPRALPDRCPTSLLKFGLCGVGPRRCRHARRTVLAKCHFEMSLNAARGRADTYKPTIFRPGISICGGTSSPWSGLIGAIDSVVAKVVSGVVRVPHRWHVSVVISELRVGQRMFIRSHESLNRFTLRMSLDPAHSCPWVVL